MTPTRTHIALLRMVVDGQVRCDHLPNERFIYHHGLLVTAAISELEEAGWVEIGPRAPGSRTGPVVITDAGRTVLGSQPA